MNLNRLFGRQSQPGRIARTPAPRRQRHGWTPRLERLEQRDTPSIAFSVNAAGNTLLRFDTATPSVTTNIAVAGLTAGEVLDGITFRTQTGQMFAVAFNNSTDQARLGTINLSTGVFTPVGAAFTVSSGTSLSLTTDPVTDRLRVISDTGANLSVNPNDGSVTVNTTLTGGITIAGVAYSGNFQGSTSATLFGIDATNDRLVTINPSTGLVTAVGTNLGIGNVTAVGGIAIQADGTALANLTVGGVTALYSINLAAGTATLIGNISGSAITTADLAVAPIFVAVSGSGSGMQATVRVYDTASGNVKTTLNPFGSFPGGVRTAVGDVNADGTADIVVGAGAGGGPHVIVFDGRTGATLFSFFAYNANFSGGVFVAAGDVNGDGRADIITGAGAGGGPHVKVFSGLDGSLLTEFFAYSANFTGGVSVAAGDLDLVGGGGVAFRDEIITGAGAGGGPHVRVFTGTGAAFTGALNSFYAYDANFTGGVFVSAGDVNGDGFADVITGAGAGGGPHVKVFSGLNASLLSNFFAYGANFTGGVRVGVADANGDGRLDIVTGNGAGIASLFKVFDANSQVQLNSFAAFDPSFLGGIFVGGA